METVCKIRSKPCLGVANVGNAEAMHQQPRGPKSARLVGGMLSVDGFA